MGRGQKVQLRAQKVLPPLCFTWVPADFEKKSFSPAAGSHGQGCVSFRGQRCSYNPIKARWANFGLNQYANTLWECRVGVSHELCLLVKTLNAIVLSFPSVSCPHLKSCTQSSESEAHHVYRSWSTTHYFIMKSTQLGIKLRKPTQLQSCNRSQISASMLYSGVVDPSGPVHLHLLLPGFLFNQTFLKIHNMLIDVELTSWRISLFLMFSEIQI